jgi:protein-L-isoaspartate(D-aspartate) O-methyltransferase
MPAIDFSALRQRMVDNQLRPSEVSDHEVIRAFLTVPRERFVGPDEQAFAYADRDLRLPGAADRGMMAPVQLARLVQMLPRRSRILVVGSGTGYSVAILAQLARPVVALEEERRLAVHAADALNALGVDGWLDCVGPLKDGCAEHAPYDGMLIDGAIEVLPESLVRQLRQGGVAVGIEQGERISRAMLWERSGESMTGWPQFEAWAPALPGFARERTFVF